MRERYEGKPRRSAGLRLRMGIALGGALIGSLAVPASALSTTLTSGPAAQTVRHYTPSSTRTGAVLAGVGWSMPVRGGGGPGPMPGPFPGPFPGPMPDGVGWS